MTSYTAVPLDYLPGGTYARAWGINDAGKIVGEGTAGDGFIHAIMWNGTTPTALDFPEGGTEAHAYGVDAGSLICGATVNVDLGIIWNGSTVSFTQPGTALRGIKSGLACGLDNVEALTFDGATEVVLDFLPGGSVADGAQANAINGSGQIAGASSDGTFLLHACIWNGTTPTALDFIGGDTQAVGLALNGSGQVVGFSGSPGQAVLWNGTTPTVLDSLPGGPADQAFGINGAGLIVGESFDGVSNFAVMWNGTSVTRLPDLDSAASLSSAATGVNTSGTIVGWISADDVFGDHAVMWVPEEVPWIPWAKQFTYIPPRPLGRVVHEIVSVAGDVHHPNVEGWQAEEEAPGGFGPASGKIAERTLRAHPDIYSFGSDWLTFLEADGTCLHASTLLEPDASAGMVQLVGRGPSYKAEIVTVENADLSLSGLGPGDDYSAAELVADLADICGFNYTDISASGTSIRPYNISPQPAADGLDYAALFTGWRWLVTHSGVRVKLEFGPYETVWDVASPWAEFNPIPQERFNYVNVPYAIDASTTAVVTIHADPDPLNVRNTYTKVSLPSFAPDETGATNLGEQLIDILVAPRWAGSGSFAEVFDTGGNRRSAHVLRAGDLMSGRIQGGPQGLKIQKVTRTETRVDVDFDGELHALDRLIARFQKRQTLAGAH